MELIVELLILGASAWMAFMITSAERRNRSWGGSASVGVFLAVFGGLSFGLLQLWGWFSPKLTDSSPSENDKLFIGLIVTAIIVILSLDLWGTIDIVGKLRDSINKGEASR